MTVQKTTNQPIIEKSIKLDGVLFLSSELEEASKQDVKSIDLNLDSVSYVNVGGEPFRVTAKGISPVGIQAESQPQNKNDNLNQSGNQPIIEYDYIEAHFRLDSRGILPSNPDVLVMQNPNFSEGILVPIDCIQIDQEGNSALVTESFETVVPYGTLLYEDGGESNIAGTPVWIMEGTELEFK